MRNSIHARDCTLHVCASGLYEIARMRIRGEYLRICAMCVFVIIHVCAIGIHARDCTFHVCANVLYGFAYVQNVQSRAWIPIARMWLRVNAYVCILFARTCRYVNFARISVPYVVNSFVRATKKFTYGTRKKRTPCPGLIQKLRTWKFHVREIHARETTYFTFAYVQNHINIINSQHFTYVLYAIFTHAKNRLFFHVRE